MDYRNDGFAEALGTYFIVLSSFSVMPSFQNLPVQTLEQKDKFCRSVGC